LRESVVICQLFILSLHLFMSPFKFRNPSATLFWPHFIISLESSRPLTIQGDHLGVSCSRPIVCEHTSVGLFLELGTDTRQLSTQVYIHLPISSRHVKELVVVYNQGFQNENVTNHWFFKVFEVIRIDGSLILNVFQRTKTDDSLILK
jgi:hypothetical protein